LQQVPAAVQAAVQTQGVAGVQRFADTTQVLVQVQPTAIPSALNFAQSAATPATPPAAFRQSSLVAAPLAAQPAAAPAAGGPLAAFNLSDAPAVQQAAAPAVPAAPVAEPAAAAAAPVYAQPQQLYPAAIAGQPVIQQLLSPVVQREQVAGLAGGFVAGTLPTAVLIGGPGAAQAIVPLDQSVADLFGAQTAAAAAAATSNSASAESSAPATDAAEEESTGADDAASAEDETSAAPRHSRSASKSGKIRSTPARKAKSADSEDDAVSAADAASDAAENDGLDAADAAGAGTRRKNSRASAKAGASSKGARRSSGRATRQDDDDDVDSADDKVARRRNRAGADDDADSADDKAATRRNRASADDDADSEDPLDDASTDTYEGRSGHRRISGGRLRGSRGSLREEAERVREEAAEEARDSVLSEIRAEASAQAALEASSELHVGIGTIVRDEGASRMRNEYETARDYRHGEAQTAYADDSTRTRAMHDDYQSGTAVRRYGAAESENIGTWDVKHAVSWANSRTNSYDEARSSYRPYDSYSGDSYAHGVSRYADSDRDSASGYSHTYPDGSYSDETYTHTYSDDSHSHTYADDSHPHTYIDDSYSDDTYSDDSSSRDYSEHSGSEERGSESQSSPYNLVNKHADSVFASDAAGALSQPSGSAGLSVTNSLRAVNDLDPLSYATQGCSFRSNLPLSAPPGSASGQPSVMIIGLPAQPTQSAVMRSVAPAASTVMVTKMVTPAVKVVYASDNDD
ncbi:hypothetical protein H4R18_004896, partial [Coemansia javaensis]